MNPLRNIPAWPTGCGLAIFNVLFMINTFAFIGALSASSKLADTAAILLPYLVIALLPIGEIIGAIVLRRRNPYAAQSLWWAVGLTIVFGAILLGLTSWLDRINGLG